MTFTCIFGAMAPHLWLLSFKRTNHLFLNSPNPPPKFKPRVKSDFDAIFPEKIEFDGISRSILLKIESVGLPDSI